MAECKSVSVVMDVPNIARGYTEMADLSKRFHSWECFSPSLSAIRWLQLDNHLERSYLFFGYFQFSTLPFYARVCVSVEILSPKKTKKQSQQSFSPWTNWLTNDSASLCCSASLAASGPFTGEIAHTWWTGDVNARTQHGPGRLPSSRKDVRSRVYIDSDGKRFSRPKEIVDKLLC